MQKLIFSAIAFSFLLLFTACGNDDMYVKEITDLREEMAEKDQELARLQSELETDGGLIHTVFFWMKDGIDDGERQQFEDGLSSLADIESVKRFYWGTPAATDERDVVDRSYDYALVVHFEDVKGHDVYGPHKIHEKFIEDSSNLWTKVAVYDATTTFKKEMVVEGTLPSPEGITNDIGGMDDDEVEE